MLQTKPELLEQLPTILVAAALQFFVCEFLVAGSWRGQYSYTQNFISDLGVPFCGPHGDLPCSTSSVLINASLLVVAAALFVAARWIVRTASTPVVGPVFLSLAATGALIVALVHSNVNWPLHSLGANLFLIFGGCALLTFGLSDAVHRRTTASVLTAAFGALALAGYFCYDNSWQFGLGPGGIERVSAYSVILGFTSLIALMSASRGRPARHTRQKSLTS